MVAGGESAKTVWNILLQVVKRFFYKTIFLKTPCTKDIKMNLTRDYFLKNKKNQNLLCV